MGQNLTNPTEPKPGLIQHWEHWDALNPSLNLAKELRNSWRTGIFQKDSHPLCDDETNLPGWPQELSQGRSRPLGHLVALGDSPQLSKPGRACHPRLLVSHGADIPVQILREHVMVRVGGGWDTLEHYLDKHDPCRCTSLCECPRPQTPRLGEEGGSVVGLDASRGRFQEREALVQPCLVVLPTNVGFWGLSLALVATRGHGRLLDGARPQKPLRRERSFLPAPSRGWMLRMAGWAAPGGGCRGQQC